MVYYMSGYRRTTHREIARRSYRATLMERKRLIVPGESRGYRSTLVGRGEGMGYINTLVGRGEGMGHTNTLIGRGDGRSYTNTFVGRGDGRSYTNTLVGRGDGRSYTNTLVGRGDGRSYINTVVGRGDGRSYTNTLVGRGDGRSYINTLVGRGDGRSYTNTLVGRGDGRSYINTLVGRGDGRSYINTLDLPQRMLPAWMVNVRNNLMVGRIKMEGVPLGGRAEAGTGVADTGPKRLEATREKSECDRGLVSRSRMWKTLSSFPSGVWQRAIQKRASEQVEGNHFSDKSASALDSPTTRMPTSRKNSKSSCTEGLPSTPRRLSSLLSVRGDDEQSKQTASQRPLRLPPLILPRLHTVAPRPMQYREFLTPTKLRGPITDEEWLDLKECRYIRRAVPRFASPPATSSESNN